MRRKLILSAMCAVALLLIVVGPAYAGNWLADHLTGTGPISGIMWAIIGGVLTAVVGYWKWLRPVLIIVYTCINAIEEADDKIKDEDILPDKYRAAMSGIVKKLVAAGIPKEVKAKLDAMIEKQIKGV